MNILGKFYTFREPQKGSTKTNPQNLNIRIFYIFRFLDRNVSDLDYGKVFDQSADYSFNNPILKDNERQKRVLGLIPLSEDYDLTSLFLHAMDRQDGEGNSQVVYLTKSI